MATTRSALSSKSAAPSTRSVESSATKKVVAPLSLAKRLLFPGLPHGHGPDLPPLLAAPGLPPELHAELYDFIALALRAFVNPWWTKITRYDKDFLVEINRILTQVLRSLEARLQATDLSPLVLCDIPTIVEQHYVDYRNAASKLSTSYASGKSTSLPQLFHQVQPHLAVSPEGQLHPEYIRQTVDHILKSCLPSEDYDSEPERFIVREIILKVLVESVIPKITQPWFVQKAILDQLGGPIPSGSIEVKDVAPHTERKFSFQSLAVLFFSSIQIISGICLALITGYKRATHLVRLVNEDATERQKLGIVTNPTSADAPTPALLIAAAPSTSPQPTPSLAWSMSTASVVSRAPSDTLAPSQPLSLPVPHYAPTLLSLLSTIISADTRLAASSVFNTLSILGAASTPFLDKLLPYLLRAHVLSAESVTKIVVTGKRTLFPDGWPAPAPADPMPEEQAAIRENLIDKILQAVPGPVAPFLLGPTETIRRETVAAAIAPLSSQECNVHLVMFILDSLLLTIFPELSESVR